MIRKSILLVALIVSGFQAKALDLTSPFESIDGGTLSLADWSGKPILVVNTASRCGFTKQYGGLQALYDSYRDRGVVVLAVPSNDFRQELSSGEEVKEFCELQFGIDMPMTDITHVKGPQSHPFFQSLKQEAGFVPSWNFNKVLIGPDGDLIATYGSTTRPQSSRIKREIEELLK